MMGPDIRQPIASGSFYSSDPGRLTKDIKGFLSNSKYHNLSGIKALISPHAGYIYSGQVAAHAYRQIEGGGYQLALVIAPSHSEYFNYISIYPGSSYATPLGYLEIDRKNSEKLAGQSRLIQFSARGHQQEHSLEVQLPFLQVVLGDIPIIPMVMGNQDPSLVQELGQALGEVFAADNILIVGSTDLSHYHPYQEAEDLDSQVKNLVEKFDIQGLANKLFSQEIEMCGGGPALAAMIAARNLGATQAKVTSYQNSGDVTGDTQAVVGYLSAVFY
ncbi:MAG: AmmeMemoRadiSam system protein B [Actinomycetota bacterium]|nr:AmmeMemoRadiSam system protein B [Actinomycetota bacterium]